jgi:hypothetical protein
MADAASAYFDEMFYQLADGFSVENDYWTSPDMTDSRLSSAVMC